MKRILAFLLLAACWLWVMTSCTTTITREIITDKAGTVTDRTTTYKGSDPAALKLVSVAAEIYLPRRAVVREEKSSNDLQRILRGHPITRQEIANRWKP